MNPILETPRLVLREMGMADLDFVASMLADPEVMRYYPKCYSRSESETWIERQLRRYARHGHGLWLAIEKATGRPVGQIGLLIQTIDKVEEREVAYLVHRPFWRHGFATEGAQACCEHAFTVLGRTSVYALIRPENVPSLAVAAKIGMTFEGRMIEHAGLAHQVYRMSRPAEFSQDPKVSHG